MKINKKEYALLNEIFIEAFLGDLAARKKAKIKMKTLLAVVEVTEK